MPAHHDSARVWLVGDTSVSLSDALNDRYRTPLSFQDFRHFCTLQYNEENIDCWKEIMTWKALYHSNDDDENKKTAGAIIERYVGSKATIATVNISDNTTSAVLKEFHNEPTVAVTLFDAALGAIEDIIHRDLFPRFIAAVEIQLDNARSKSLALWCFHCGDIKSFSDFFQFPNHVNEAESRCHQFLASFQMISFLLIGYFTPYWYCYLYIAYGYFVRVIAGPRLCPNAWFVLFVMHPLSNKYNLLHNKLSPGSPKRFAQLVGLMCAAAYCILFSFSPWAARAVALVHVSVSLLAGTTGFCLGCFSFELLVELEYEVAQWKKGVTRASDTKKVYVQPTPTDLTSELQTGTKEDQPHHDVSKV